MMILNVRMQQIDVERRQQNYEAAEKMYTKLLKQIPTKHDKYKNMKTWIAMKFARFQFKICNDVEKVNNKAIIGLFKTYYCGSKLLRNKL